MQCLYCGTKISRLRKFKDSEFCSAEHRDLFHEEQNSLALARLVQAKPRFPKESKSAADVTASAPTAKNVRPAAVPIDDLVPQDLAVFFHELPVVTAPSRAEPVAAAPESILPSVRQPAWPSPAAVVRWDPVGYLMRNSGMRAAEFRPAPSFVNLKQEKFREIAPELELRDARRAPIWREASTNQEPALASPQPLPLPLGAPHRPAAQRPVELSPLPTGEVPAHVPPGAAPAAFPTGERVLPVGLRLLRVVPGGPLGGAVVPASQGAKGAVMFRTRRAWTERLDASLRVTTPASPALGTAGRIAPTSPISIAPRGPQPGPPAGVVTALGVPPADALQPSRGGRRDEPYLEVAGLERVALHPPRADTRQDVATDVVGMVPPLWPPTVAPRLPLYQAEVDEVVWEAAWMAPITSVLPRQGAGQSGTTSVGSIASSAAARLPLNGMMLSEPFLDAASMKAVSLAPSCLAAWTKLIPVPLPFGATPALPALEAPAPKAGLGVHLSPMRPEPEAVSWAAENPTEASASLRPLTPHRSRPESGVEMPWLGEVPPSDCGVRAADGLLNLVPLAVAPSGIAAWQPELKPRSRARVSVQMPGTRGGAAETTVRLATRLFPLRVESARSEGKILAAKLDATATRESPWLPPLPAPPTGEEAHRITAELLADMKEELFGPASKWAISRLWKRTPAPVKTSIFSLLVLFTVGVAGTGSSPAQWDSLREGIHDRAAVNLVDDFRIGLGAWAGDENWAESWSYDAAGLVRTGALSLYQPSLPLTDYRMEFLAQIGDRSLGWVFRATDTRNYYAMKISITQPGPLPSTTIVRYRVVEGRPGPQTRLPLPMVVRNDTMYRVRVSVQGDTFITSVQDQVVDVWSDGSLKTGGVGFFSDKGEYARLRWVEVSHQYDLLGRLCAYLAP